MDTYFTPIIPLAFLRSRAGAPVTGYTVTVSVINALTGATLLPSTACAELPAGSGNYFYLWTHGLLQDTLSLVTYTVAGQKMLEYIFISGGPSGGRAT